MADGDSQIRVKSASVPALSDAAAIARALGRVQAYLLAMQGCYVSEDVWWGGFSRLFRELERPLRNPIALEIAVDQLLVRHGSTSWSVQRFRMAR